MPHNIIHGDACFAYFNKIWGIPTNSGMLVPIETIGDIIQGYVHLLIRGFLACDS